MLSIHAQNQIIKQILLSYRQLKIQPRKNPYEILFRKEGVRDTFDQPLYLEVKICLDTALCIIRFRHPEQEEGCISCKDYIKFNYSTIGLGFNPVPEDYSHRISLRFLELLREGFRNLLSELPSLCQGEFNSEINRMVLTNLVSIPIQTLNSVSNFAFRVFKIFERYGFRVSDYQHYPFRGIGFEVFRMSRKVRDNIYVSFNLSLEYNRTLYLNRVFIHDLDNESSYLEYSHKEYNEFVPLEEESIFQNVLWNNLKILNEKIAGKCRWSEYQEINTWIRGIQESDKRDEPIYNPQPPFTPDLGIMTNMVGKKLDLYSYHKESFSQMEFGELNSFFGESYIYVSINHVHQSENRYIEIRCGVLETREIHEVLYDNLICESIIQIYNSEFDSKACLYSVLCGLTSLHSQLITRIDSCPQYQVTSDMKKLLGYLEAVSQIREIPPQSLGNDSSIRRYVRQLDSQERNRYALYVDDLAVCRNLYSLLVTSMRESWDVLDKLSGKREEILQGVKRHPPLEFKDLPSHSSRLEQITLKFADGKEYPIRLPESEDSPRDDLSSIIGEIFFDVRNLIVKKVRTQPVRPQIVLFRELISELSLLEEKYKEKV